MELCLSSTWLSSVTSSTAWVTFTSTTLTTGSKTGWQVTTRHTQLSPIIRLAMSVFILIITSPTATRKQTAATRIKPAVKNNITINNTEGTPVHCQLQLLLFTSFTNLLVMPSSCFGLRLMLPVPVLDTDRDIYRDTDTDIDRAVGRDTDRDTDRDSYRDTGRAVGRDTD